jgi:hypothetical protein
MLSGDGGSLDFPSFQVSNDAKKPHSRTDAFSFPFFTMFIAGGKKLLELLMEFSRNSASTNLRS